MIEAIPVRLPHLLPSAAYVMASVVIAAGGASAQVLVLSSDVDTIKSNTEIAETAKLKVPAGKSVRVLLPSGATAVIDGPADKSVRELSKGQTGFDPVWTWMKEYLTGRDSKAAAASRGAYAAVKPTLAERGPLAVSTLLSWSAVPVPVNVNGSICVLDGASLSFARLSLSAPPKSDDNIASMQFTPGDELGPKPFIVQWRPTEEKAPWPNAVKVQDGGRYYAFPNFAEPSKFELKTVGKDTVEGNQILKVLYQQGCFEQIKAWTLAGGRRQ